MVADERVVGRPLEIPGGEFRSASHMNNTILFMVLSCLPVPHVMSGTVLDPASVRSVESGLSISSLDELTLITGEVFYIVSIKKAANVVFFVDDQGKQHQEPVAMIKHIRKSGAVEPITLEEALGEAASGRGGSDGGSVGKEGRPSGEKEQRSSKTAILLLDHSSRDFDADVTTCYERAFEKLDQHSPDIVIVGVHDVELPIEAASWMSSRLQGLDPGIEVRVLLGRTAATSLLLFPHADKVHWLEEGLVSASSLDPSAIKRISGAAPMGVTASAIEAMGRGGTVSVDSLGRLVAGEPGTGSVGIDAGMARSIGICHGVAGGVRKTDVEALLGAGVDRRFREIRIATEVTNLKREREKARRRVEAGRIESENIKEAAGRIRASASAFDRFYRDPRYRVDLVWKKDRTWKDREDRQKSSRLQGDVLSAILALKNAQKTLDNIVNLLPDETAEKNDLARCADQAKQALGSLSDYAAAIERNRVESYEADRDVALTLNIGGC